MIEQDTIKLLRKCDAGIAMGVEAIDEVFDKAESREFKNELHDCKQKHIRLGHEITSALHRFGDAGRSPNPMAAGMSFIKTNLKMMSDKPDSAAADIITDGCSMGIKSLSRYLNMYKAADETSKDCAKKLIKIEEDLCNTARRYL